MEYTRALIICMQSQSQTDSEEKKKSSELKG